jgi:hypothetical protein
MGQGAGGRGQGEKSYLTLTFDWLLSEIEVLSFDLLLPNAQCPMPNAQ